LLFKTSAATRPKSLDGVENRIRSLDSGYAAAHGVHDLAVHIACLSHDGAFCDRSGERRLWAHRVPPTLVRADGSPTHCSHMRPFRKGLCKAPVRVLARRDMIAVPPVAASSVPEKDWLDQWLVTKKLDADGSPDGSVYKDISSLVDPSSQRTTPRTTYLYAKLPDAKLACAPASRSPVSEVRKRGSE
jgi:hypothetical protein